MLAERSAHFFMPFLQDFSAMVLGQSEKTVHTKSFSSIHSCDFSQNQGQVPTRSASVWLGLFFWRS